ncbi:MAG TPA: TIGR04283 family arsenosugar biosynthesis glycosyltransferase [Candidatus Binatia bacterium]|jgi:rSAM/selenodomain-associated transferase 2|nr:TIGR04283 family arsenosugar biosynthesis glycosyltransferase [Candidatus Binatia bacterium]
MNISVIIPVLNEEKNIAATLQSLARFAPFEIIVVGGGSTDRTAEICQQFGVKVTACTPSRARQMNSGAKAASGDILLFLHADTTLPNSAFDDIRLALGDSRYVGGRFDVELDGEHWMLKVIGAMINYRSRLSKVSTGDQAIFVRRFVFEQIGGYPDIPLMEDIAFCRALRRTGEIACLKSRVMTSARRWEIDGVWRTILRMWALKLLYLAGVSPNRLKQYYADAR